VRQDLDATESGSAGGGADDNLGLPLHPPTPEARRQLSLFQSFYGPAATRERSSNVIEIWDAAPKYVTPRRGADCQGKVPTVLERTFDYRGTRFRVAVAPVIFRDARGRDVTRLPTAREELIEDVLRHMAIRQHLGFVGRRDGDAIFGVRFSLDMLRRELARHGHGIKHPDLVDSLMVMSGCVVDLAYTDRRTALHRSTILSSLTGISREDYLRDPRSLWEAHFHPMVAASLSAMAYRQYDYEVTMGYRASLTRWFHKHLALAFLNAGMLNAYAIRLSTLRENSGLVNRSSLRHQARDVEDALRELKGSAHPVLRNFDREALREGSRLADVRYTLHPTAEFVRQVVAANRRQRDGKDAIPSPSRAESMRLPAS
jgi:hypothetical protein